jgi:hypothetical protein
MTAAGGTGNLTAGALSIPVTYDASALAAQASKMQAEAEKQGTQVGQAMDRGRQRAIAQANRQGRIARAMSGDDAENYAGSASSMFAKPGSSSTEAFARSARQVEQFGKVFIAASAGARGFLAVTEALGAITSSSTAQYKRAQEALQGLANSIPIVGSTLAGIISSFDTLGRYITQQENGLKRLDEAWAGYAERQKQAYDGLVNFNKELSKRQEGAQSDMLSGMFGGENFSDFGKLINAQRDQQLKLDRQQELERNKFKSENAVALAGGEGANVQAVAKESERKLLETQAQERENFRNRQRQQEAQFARDKAATEERVTKEKFDKETQLAKDAADKQRQIAEQQQRRIQDVTKSAIDARERELAILRGMGKEYERNQLRLQGMSEIDQERLARLDQRIEREKKQAEDKKAMEQEIADLERQRMRTVTTSAMEVDRSRTAFGASTGVGKMEVEDKAVVRQIEKLNVTLKSMVLQ